MMLQSLEHAAGLQDHHREYVRQRGQQEPIKLLTHLAIHAWMGLAALGLLVRAFVAEGPVWVGNVLQFMVVVTILLSACRLVVSILQLVICFFMGTYLQADCPEGNRSLHKFIKGSAIPILVLRPTDRAVYLFAAFTDCLFIGGLVFGGWTISAVFCLGGFALYWMGHSVFRHITVCHLMRLSAEELHQLDQEVAHQEAIGHQP